MNMCAKYLVKIILLPGMLLLGCTPGRFVNDPLQTELLEKEFVLNTFQNDIQLVRDSFCILKNGQESLYLINIYTGEVTGKLAPPDSIFKSIIRQVSELFPGKNVFTNQDSLNTIQKSDFPLKNMYHFSFANDTLRCIAYYTVTGYSEFMLEGIKRRGFVRDAYPVLLKANKRLRLISWDLLCKDSVDIVNLDVALPFTYNNANYFFPNVISFVLKSPGAKQLRAYTERNGRFYSLPGIDKSLTLSEALTKKMGYSDTTVRNAGSPQPEGNDDFDYTMRTLNGQVFFCNKFQLVNLSSGHEYFDGIKNAFSIHGYSLFPDGVICLLIQKQESKHYTIQIYDKSMRVLKDETLSLEDNERVLNADVNENNVIFLIQKNEKPYFKIFNYVYAEKR